MPDILDWGAVEYGDVSVGRYPVIEGGRRLFLIRDGQVEFPSEDFRRWLPIGVGVSAVGRVNTNTLEFEVELPKSLASSDDQKFNAVVILRLKLRPTLEAWHSAAERHAELELSIRALVQRAAEMVLSSHSYRDIYFADSNILQALSVALEDGLKVQTPYDLVSCTFDATARDISVDQAMEAAQREIAIEAERARNEVIEKERLERQRALEREQLGHETDLNNKRSQSERESEAAKIRLRIALEEEAALSKAKVIKTTLEGVADPAALLAITDPALYVELRKSENLTTAKTEQMRLTKDYDSGVAAGLIKGVQGALGMQNLSPETLRIVHETPRDAEPDTE